MGKADAADGASVPAPPGGAAAGAACMGEVYACSSLKVRSPPRALVRALVQVLEELELEDAEDFEGFLDVMLAHGRHAARPGS